MKFTDEDLHSSEAGASLRQQITSFIEADAHRISRLLVLDLSSLAEIPDQLISGMFDLRRRLGHKHPPDRAVVLNPHPDVHNPGSILGINKILPCYLNMSLEEAIAQDHAAAISPPAM